MNATVITTLSTNIPNVHGLVHPSEGPTESPSINMVTAIDSDQLPIHYSIYCATLELSTTAKK